MSIKNLNLDNFRVFPIIAPHENIAPPPLWYNYHDWEGGGIGCLTTKLGGGGYNGKDPNFLLI